MAYRRLGVPVGEVISLRSIPTEIIIRLMFGYNKGLYKNDEYLRVARHVK